MKTINNSLILTKDDHNLLISYLRGWWHNKTVDRRYAEALQAELKGAKLVETEVAPADVVRLNSKVLVKTSDKNETLEITLVTPEEANIKEKKVSILAPIGTALIGFRKGQKVNWNVPAGKKTFTILDVINS
ncbi:MAG TPA: GreA/GreB family elongation factor [Ferruginibacter sp.]|nr:GreA/GreB family elongation factor [Ferruginibacter sp.]